MNIYAEVHQRLLISNATHVRRHWFQYLRLVHEQGLWVVILHRRRPQVALVPFALARGLGVTIKRRGGDPVASLVPVNPETGEIELSTQRIRDWLTTVGPVVREAQR